MALVATAVATRRDKIFRAGLSNEIDVRRVWAENQITGGAVFRLALPVAKRAQEGP